MHVNNPGERPAADELSGLRRFDILGARAFFPHAFRERHPLAFVQFIETDTLHGRRMKEQIFVARRLDESETLVSQFFDASFGHSCVP